MAGIDPVLGFVRRTIDELKLQLEADEIANISPSLDVSSTSPVGSINSAVLKVADELWELAEATYVAGDPDRATGDAQDAICALTGTSREAAARSQVAENLTLGVAVTVTAGSIVAVAGNPTARFVLIGPEPAPGDPVVPGDVTSVGAGTYAARFQSEATGPIAANAGTLTVIVTPITGWSAATNPLDAVPGHDIEGSTALRIRREEEIADLGASSVDAIQAKLTKLLAANNVIGSATVVDNFTDVVDADGRPAHSLEALVNDGGALDDDDIAQAIWDDKPAGIQTFGATSGTATDVSGVHRTINFNRPTLIPIYFAITVVVNPDVFPSDGDVQIQEGIVEWGETEGSLTTRRKPGEDVIQNSFYRPIWAVPGIMQVTVLDLDVAPAPASSADIAIATRELATFDSSRVAVTVT